MAELRGVKVASIRKRLTSLRLVPLTITPRVEIPADKWEWAVGALREGLPAVWVAETLGVDSKHLGYRFKRETGELLPFGDYQKVWPSIFHRKHLLELHRMFAPKVRQNNDLQ